MGFSDWEMVADLIDLLSIDRVVYECFLFVLQHIIQEKVSGKKLNIPPPRYNSGGVKNIFTKS